MGLLLFIASIILLFIFLVPVAIYSFFRLLKPEGKTTYWQRFNKLCRDGAFAVDVLGCSWFKLPLNDLFILKNGYQFGCDGDTISHALRINKENNTLRALGKFTCWLLDSIQKDHIENAAPELIANPGYWKYLITNTWPIYTVGGFVAYGFIKGFLTEGYNFWLLFIPSISCFIAVGLIYYFDWKKKYKNK